MKTIKKALSILLVLATLFSISATSTLSASAATYSESESNDSYSMADTLKVGNKIEGKMNSHSDVDIYKVTVSSSGILTLKFIHEHDDNGGGWNVEIYQCSDGKYTLLSNQTIYRDSDAKIVLPFVGTRASEEYYVRIDTWNNAVLYKEYSIIAKSSTEPSVDIGTGGSDNNDNDNNNDVTDLGFSFMDVLNAVLDFFKWLFGAVLSFFS